MAQLNPPATAAKRTGEFGGPDVDQAKPRVLVIDDDWEICDAVKDALDDAGYEAVCLSNGASALEHLARNPLPAAILLDLFMPVMDGWTFADRLRSVPRLSGIPIVVMTASGPHWGYPAPRVLRKPVLASELIAAVNRAIADEGAGSAASF
jgi:CheY-like chemotaxis protein